jgi:hypothetical protein
MIGSKARRTRSSPGYGRMTAYGPKVRPTIVNSARPEKRRDPCSGVAINRVAGVAKGAKSGALYRAFGRWFYDMIGAFGARSSGDGATGRFEEFQTVTNSEP